MTDGAAARAGCSPEPAANSYEVVAEQTWRPGALTGFNGAVLGRELVRCATLAPSSHNTACWTFALAGFIVQGHTAQMAGPAFVKELKTWIRFNGQDALHTRDGLHDVFSDQPNLPIWIDERLFDWLYTPHSENDKLVRQVRSAAGLAVFEGQGKTKANWVKVGRYSQRFAPQAAALGIRNAMLNQPLAAVLG